MTGAQFLDTLCGSSTVLGLSDKNVNDTTWRATVLGWLNLVLKDISNRQQNFHWRWLEKTVTTPTVIDQHSYDLPSDIDSNKILSVYDRTADRTLIFKPYDEFVRLVPDPSSSTGSAYWYTLFAKTLRLYPIPASVYTVFMDYVKTITDLADDANTPDIPSKYDHIVINGVLEYIYKFDPDMGDWGTQRKAYESGIDNMIKDNNMSPNEIKIPESKRLSRRLVTGRGPFPI
jgi:hypothetical protein